MRLLKLLLAFMLMLFGCTSQQSLVAYKPSELRIKGSDSMLLLVQRLSEQFMLRHPGISILVEGGGSGSGIQALVAGSADVCASSRPFTPEEVHQLANKFRSIGVSILAAKDALSIVVHPSNPVSTLSFQQITDIFTGAVTNWNQIGGINAPITVYGRESNSGTYLYFEEHVLLGKEYLEDCSVVPGARAMISAVAQDSTAIGYSTAAYTAQVKTIAINGVLPSADNIRHGSYPIIRYLYFYTVQQPEGTIKQFLDWVVSTEGQRTAQANGYIPLYPVD